MKLTETKIGSDYKVVGIRKGWKLRYRLSELGLTGDCIFTTLVNNQRGPVLIEIRGTRLALGEGMADKIEVEIIS